MNRHFIAIFEWACSKGHLGLVREIVLRNDFNIFEHSKDGLEVACVNGHFDVAKEIIKLGIKASDKLESIFKLSCEYGHTELVKMIISLEEFDINSFDISIFENSIKNEHYEIAIMLFEKWLKENKNNMNVMSEKKVSYMELILILRRNGL